MCAILTNGTQLLFEWMNLSVTYSLTNIKILKRIRKQEERLESNQYHSPGTRVKFRELRLPIAHSPLWLYNMTNTKQSLCLLFSHLYRRFAVRSSCTLNVQPTAFPFALPVPAIQSPAWFILSAFTAFATSGDALAGLSLLSILGRRSWIVSLAPSYMPFFCVSIFQRTSFCGRKRCDPQELSEARA